MTFSSVDSIHACPAKPDLALALLRRFCETKAETWSEKASRAREFAGFTR